METIETTTEVQEQTTDQFDAFDAGFDGDETPVTAEEADQPAEAVEGQTEQEVESETAESAPESEAEGEVEQGEQSQTKDDAAAQDSTEKQAPASWVIKHMGEEKTVTSEEITPELLQKGYDYERIRSKYDEAKPVMEIFSDLAKKAGMSVGDYAKMLRVELKKAEGQTEAEAKRTVDLEDREAAIAAQEATKQEALDAQQAKQAKMQADIADFRKAFPDVYKKATADPKVIPQSVYDDVGRGFSLTASYGRYLDSVAQQSAARLAEKTAVAEQGQKNAARATGSMKSAGQDMKSSDSFLDGFGD